MPHYKIFARGKKEISERIFKSEMSHRFTFYHSSG